MRAITDAAHCYSQVTAPDGSAVAVTSVRAKRTDLLRSAMAVVQDAVAVVMAGVALRSRVDRIRWAGTATAIAQRGSTGGAISVGKRPVAELIGKD